MDPVTLALAKREASRAIGPYKVTGKNLFDGAYLHATFGGSPGGAPANLTASNGRTAIVQVEPGKTYTVSRSVDTDRFRIAGHNSYPQPPETLDVYLFLNDGHAQATVSVPEGIHYLLIYLSTTGQGAEPAWLQVEEGAAATPYEPHTVSLNAGLLDGQTPQEFVAHLPFVAPGKNKFDGAYLNATIGGSPGGAPPKLHPNNGRTALVRVEPATLYTVSRSGDTDRFRIAGHGSVPQPDEELDVYLFLFDERTEATVYVPEGVHYLLVCVSSATQGSEPAWLQVEEGGAATTHEPYAPNRIRGDLVVPAPAAFIADLPATPFEPNGDTALSAVLSADVDDLYDVYDALATAHPEYVSRTHLTNDEAGLPIYRYDFTPTAPAGHAPPRVLWVTCTHGHETIAAYSAAAFFTDLCDRWEDSDLLRALRWNVHLVVIPALNPWGVNNNSRKNSVGIDLNRNFPAGWQYEPDTNSEYYAGEEPASTVGVQLMLGLLESEPRPLIAVDHHNFASPAADGLAVYTANAHPTLHQPLLSAGQLLQSRIEQHYAEAPAGINYDVRVPGAGRLSRQFAAAGYRGFLLETVERLSGETNTPGTQDRAGVFTMDVMGNLLYGLLRRYASGIPG